MILYLHGFRSSPQSFKAKLLAQRLATEGRLTDYICPQLPASPQAAIQLALQLATSISPSKLTLIGSSLGGFYATWLAEKLGCRAVLLNPAVTPWRDLQHYQGVTTAYHSATPFEFKQTDVDQLQPYAVEHITQPQRYFLIAAKGDQVLDWRQMIAHYPGCLLRLLDGSNHGLSDFEQYLDAVLAFCERGLLPSQ